MALQAIAGRLTLGDLTLFTAAAASVQGSVQGLLSGFGSMYENNLYLNDLFELLAAPIGIEHRAAADGARPRTRGPALAQTAGEIVFDHVTFRYPGRDEDAIADVSFTDRCRRDRRRRRAQRGR